MNKKIPLTRSILMLKLIKKVKIGYSKNRYEVRIYKLFSAICKLRQEWYYYTSKT